MGLLSELPELYIFFTKNNKYSNSMVGGGSFYTTLDNFQEGLACARTTNVLFLPVLCVFSLFKIDNYLVDIRI